MSELTACATAAAVFLGFFSGMALMADKSKERKLLGFSLSSACVALLAAAFFT